MATVAASMTIEDYLAVSDRGLKTELIEGKVIEVPPPGAIHCRICARITRFLGNFVDEHQLGEIFSNDMGVITHRNPDSLRGADVSFYRTAKLSPIEDWPGYFELPPDLVVEVRSPSDRWTEVLEKVTEYLTVGVPIVVVLDPASRSAHTFTADQAPRTLGPEGTLTFPDLLPDFAVVVGRIFD